MKKALLFTSESVTEAHPDRICDTISDALVDSFLRQDPLSKITAECALSKHVVFLAARFASLATVDIPEVARSVLQDMGYQESDFSATDCTVVTSLTHRPLDHRSPVDEAHLEDSDLDRIVVSNQVTLFGYACTQTPELMPLPIVMANRVARQITAARKAGRLPHLSPDATVQAGIEYRGTTPQRMHSITIIIGQERPYTYDEAELKDLLTEEVIRPALHGQPLTPDEGTLIHVNPQEGHFIKSGPAAHSGMTGRKTTADTYGAWARHSGSALSGKGPTRIDRIGAYAARYAAKNLVAADLARECEVQLSYTIGHAGPVSIEVETFGTGTVDDEFLSKRLQEAFDFRLGAIIRDFRLRHLPTERSAGFYRWLPAHGHFANAFLDLPWERTDRLSALK